MWKWDLQYYCLFQRNHEELLSIQLEHAGRDVEEGCPVFAPRDGEVSLQHIVDRIKQDKNDTGKGT